MMHWFLTTDLVLMMLMLTMKKEEELVADLEELLLDWQACEPPAAPDILEAASVLQWPCRHCTLQWGNQDPCSKDPCRLQHLQHWSWGWEEGSRGGRGWCWVT